MSSLVTLSLSFLLKRHVYELFLYLHRAVTIILVVALWQHVNAQQNLSRILLITAFGTFLVSTTSQSARQIYKNSSWDRYRARFVRISEIRRYDESVIVELKLSRPWKIQPGEYLYLSLLTRKYLSFLQRHPFVITWWESEHDKEQTQIIYIMIDPQRGWTKTMHTYSSVFKDKIAWLDGPFGHSYQLEEYGTVILFASGNGIFAQLPLLKGLVERSKFAAVKTRRIKLVWQTDTYHEQLRQWMQSLLMDEMVHIEVSDAFGGDTGKHCLHIQLLDISVHRKASLQEAGSDSKIYNMGRRVRIINDVPDVGKYIQLELEKPRESIAVTGKWPLRVSDVLFLDPNLVSGDQQLRHDVRQQVLQVKRNDVCFWELDYQPVYTNKHKGGTAA